MKSAAPFKPWKKPLRQISPSAVSLSCERTFPRNCGPPVFGACSFLRGPQALVSVSRHAEGGDIYASFLLRSSPETRMETICHRWYKGGWKPVVRSSCRWPPVRPPPNVNTNASAVTAPPPRARCHDFK